MRRAKSCSIAAARAAAIRGANRANRRLVKQKLVHLCLFITQENDEIILSAGKSTRAARRDLEFRTAGFLGKQPLALTGDGEHAAGPQMVEADI